MAPTQTVRRVMTKYAPKRGSRPVWKGDRVAFNATRGSKVQVFHGTAHHTSGGLTKSDLTRNPKTHAIVSLSRRRAGMKRWKEMSAEDKMKFKANMGRGFN